MSTDADFEQQMPSLWGLAHCPNQGSIVSAALNNNSTNSTSNGRYDSDVVICSAHAVVTLAAGIALLLCFTGVEKVTVKGSIATIKQILPCFRDQEHGATHNTRFVLYFLCTSFGALLTVLSILMDQHRVITPFRIAMQVGQRLFVGASAVLLTIALNHQREHRHSDAFHSDIGIVQLVAQVRKINYAVVVVFCVYLAAELVASFLNTSHALRVAMSALSFVVMLVLNAPIIAAAAWVAVHKGHVAPELAARVALMFGVVMRFIGTMDPSFWNKLLLESWATAHPCALGGELSFYNLLQIINVVAQLCILGFVVSEFRRSRSIVTQESSLIASAQYDDFDDQSSNGGSEGDLQRSASLMRD